MKLEFQNSEKQNRKRQVKIVPISPSKIKPKSENKEMAKIYEKFEKQRNLRDISYEEVEPIIIGEGVEFDKPIRPLEGTRVRERLEGIRNSPFILAAGKEHVEIEGKEKESKEEAREEGVDEGKTGKNKQDAGNGSDEVDKEMEVEGQKEQEEEEYDITDFEFIKLPAEGFIHPIEVMIDDSERPKTPQRKESDKVKKIIKLSSIRTQ